MSRETIRDKLGMNDPLVETLEQELLEEVYEVEPEVVSTNFDRLQVEEACRTELNFLAALAMPANFKYMFPHTYLTMWQILRQGAEDPVKKFLQFAFGIPRGHAKTTLLKLFVLWIVLFTKKKFILVVCSTEVHATNFIADVIAMLNERNVTAVFGNWKLGIDTDTKTLKKFGFRGRNINIMAIGAGGSVRGTNVNNERPDVIIMDDIQTKECADSVVQSEDLKTWMVGTLMKAKSPFGCMFLFAGNMYAPTHSILKQLKTNPTWTKFISGAILADGTALWPELRSLESLIDELNNDISMGAAHIFFAEVLNDTEAGINSDVDYSKFPAWPWLSEDMPQGKFLLIDPSQGKGKDADVIVSCEVYDSKVGIRAVKEAYYSPRNLILSSLVIAIKSETYCIAIESMAYQSTLLFWFEEVCKEFGISGISFVPIYTNQYSKNSRISSGIKAMQTSEIYLHPSIRSQVQKQIADWNPMKRDNKDDILDAISNAPKVVAEYTYDIMVRGSLLIQEADSAEVVENNHAF